LYDLWHYGVTRPEGSVRVNLHFSRDTRWATITSHLPAEGCIEVLMKTRGVLAVRIPSDRTNAQVEATVNGMPRHETVRGSYAMVEALHPGDQVVVKWPLTERTQTYAMDASPLTGRWHGDTLLTLDPPGLLTPLYHRSAKTPAAPAYGAIGPVREIDTL